MVLISIVFLNSCNKELENKLQKDNATSKIINKKSKTDLTENVDTNSTSANRTAPNNTASLEYLMYLTSPMRDIPVDYKRKNINFSNAATICCNGICGIPASTTSSSFSPQENSIIAGTSCIPIPDPNGIPISFKAQYGPDPRQIYYIYLPKAAYNGKIVLLIHGGGWCAGPNPDLSDGWGSDYSTDPDNVTLVSDLRDNGYVVISMLYRLVKYGDNNAEYTANNIGMQEQINDINSCVTHVHDNFPSCLGISTNDIQVFGESAGAHLALMYAYTQANTTYVKSVVSAAGPTNLAQLANYVNNKGFWHTFACGTNFRIGNPITTSSHNPFYLPTSIDPTELTTTASVSPLTCTWTNNNTLTRVMDAYRLAQSCVRQVVTTPLTSTAFINMSPCSILTNARIVPTFIIHGTDDWVVPYTQATNTMDTRLTNVGGLIGTLSSTSTNTIPDAIPDANGRQHLIKLYQNGNHNVGNTNIQVRPDMMKWFSKH